MKLTREKAIELFREHWKWLAESGSENKNKWTKWNFNNSPIWENCFLCEYIHQNNLLTEFGALDCNKCIVEWVKNHNEFNTPCENSYYSDWLFSTTKKERQRYAKIISELPEKKDA